MIFLIFIILHYLYFFSHQTQIRCLKSNLHPNFSISLLLSFSRVLPEPYRSAFSTSRSLPPWERTSLRVWPCPQCLSRSSRSNTIATCCFYLGWILGWPKIHSCVRLWTCEPKSGIEWNSRSLLSCTSESSSLGWNAAWSSKFFVCQLMHLKPHYMSNIHENNY